MKISSQAVTGLVIGVVMLTVLLSVGQTVIPTGATAFYNLMTTGFSNSTVFGTGASSLASNMPGYVGWFWVLGPFILVIGLIGALFFYKGRRR